MSAGDRDTLTDEQRKRITLAVYNDKDRGHGYPIKAETLDEVIASIIRAAQAQAWDECCDFHYREGNALPNMGEGPCDENPYRLDAGDEFQNPED